MPTDCWNLHQTCVSGFCGLATCDIMVIHCQQFWMRQTILHCQHAAAHLALSICGSPSCSSFSRHNFTESESARIPFSTKSKHRRIVFCRFERRKSPCFHWALFSSNCNYELLQWRENWMYAISSVTTSYSFQPQFVDSPSHWVLRVNSRNSVNIWLKPFFRQDKSSLMPQL